MKLVAVHAGNIVAFLNGIGDGCRRGIIGGRPVGAKRSGEEEQPRNDGDREQHVDQKANPALGGGGLEGFPDGRSEGLLSPHKRDKGRDNTGIGAPGQEFRIKGILPAGNVPGHTDLKI